MLDVLRERGRRGLPWEELHRQLFNRQRCLLTYRRTYANQGATTSRHPGNRGRHALAKIDRIRSNAARALPLPPVRRVHIPKPNGRIRPLDLPTWSDWLSGEVVRLLLEV